MIELFRSLVEAKSGVSSMRWVFIWTYLVSTMIPLVAWAVVFVRNNGQGDIPTGVVTLVIAVIGAVTTGKVWQKKEETKDAGVAPETK